MQYDVFISYSSVDQKIAEGVCAYLEQHGIRCFVAYRDIPRGVVWAGAIVEALEHSRLMLVLFSKHFNDSRQVDREIELAAEQGMPILTFRLSNDDFTGAKKYYLKNLNWIDAFPNPERSFGSLKDNVCKLLGKDPTPISAEELTESEQQPELLKMEEDSPSGLTGDMATHPISNHSRKWEFVIIIGLIVIVTAVAIGLQWNNARRVEEERKALVAQMRNDSIARAVRDSQVQQSASSSMPATTGKINGHEYVDLGLSVKWATCNVGADSPEDDGNYYAWGETITKRDYSRGTYEYLKNGDYTNLGQNISGTQYDVARAHWGGTWRLPTLDETKELLDKCSWSWTIQKGVNGCRVTGKNGKSIFLPAAGDRLGTEVNYRGSRGLYWAGTLNEYYSSNAYHLYFDSGRHFWLSIYRYYGRTVRPVTE